MKARTLSRTLPAILLSLLMLLPLCSLFSACARPALMNAPTRTEAAGSFFSADTLLADADASPAAAPLVYTANDYKTYAFSDVSFIKDTPDVSVSGKKCTAMQGMNVGTTYIYTVKISSDESVATIHRTNANDKTQIEMKYYSSLTATTPSACDTVGHANELSVCGVNENGKTVNYMFAATLKTPYNIARMKINGDGLYFTGYFDLKYTNGKSFSASALRPVKVEDGYIYFLIKRANDFYYCRIPQDATGGTKSAPAPITCYKLFTIDTRNVIVVKSDGSTGTLDNVENWTNQGFAYNKNEQVVYVPIWDQFGNQARNLILVYDIGKHVTPEALCATTDKTDIVFPCTTSFLITDTTQNFFEIESCGFRTEQSSTGDNKLYFNVNARSVSKEGIYAVNYTSGTGPFVPIATTEQDVVYDVKYDANGGKDTGTGNRAMNTTRHVKGITTRLRINMFTREGYTFTGWNLTRKSDGKWLYFDIDGTARWYTKGEQPVSARPALYENRRSVTSLTSAQNDTITCYAQWRANEDILPQHGFTIEYDANGGAGAMAETTVSAGNAATLRANAFVRTGYTFAGWFLYRTSDDCRLYYGIDGNEKWATPADLVAGDRLLLIKDKEKIPNLAATENDTILCIAQWSPAGTRTLADEFRVEYNANGGKGKITALTLAIGASFALPENQFQYQDHAFSGWAIRRASDNKWLYRSTNGTTFWWSPETPISGAFLACFNEGDEIPTPTELQTDVITCFAQWTPDDLSISVATFTIKYNANGGSRSMPTTAVTPGNKVSLRTNGFVRVGHIFSGWTAHRKSDDAWCYINTDTLEERWITNGESTKGYILKVYPNTDSAARVSVVNGDVVTMYAVWTKTIKTNLPETFVSGGRATFRGAIVSSANLQKVTVSVQTTDGKILASKTVRPCARSYNVANLNKFLNLPALACGTYVYTVTVCATASDGSEEPITLLSHQFTILP